MGNRLAVALVVVSAMVFSASHAFAGPMVVGGSYVDIRGVEPLGDKTKGHWDSKSYDSASRAPGQCTASGFVGGIGCDWAASPDNLSIPGGFVADLTKPFNYLASDEAGDVGTPLDFYFSGDFWFDVAALVQVTEWDTHLEFGWYAAGNPDSRTPILSGGPWVDNLGGPNLDGTGKVLLTGDYGFYYMNTQFGEGDLAIVYYTQSMYNQAGAYFRYFERPVFGTRPMDPLLEGLWRDDIRSVQQFILLNQGNTFWLGLEDQFGRTTSVPCLNQEDELMQPCSDYDYNDLIVRMTASTPVPEPTTLTMLAMGLFGAALALRRRQRDM